MMKIAQGAAQAFEDAAVLGALFSKVQNEGQIRNAIYKYEQLRKPRATKIVQESSANGLILHMPDGEEQRERDRQLRYEEPSEGFPNRWADPVFQRWLFDYDPVGEVEKLEAELDVGQRAKAKL
ncbi:MAG: hypothetical protein LQ346_003766 [Caloplaca aetnensis]|nr:MAG: hypothetical protein LQ346_003766 [Caloplaca aetnensis]